MGVQEILSSRLYIIKGNSKTLMSGEQFITMELRPVCIGKYNWKENILFFYFSLQENKINKLRKENNRLLINSYLKFQTY